MNIINYDNIKQSLKGTGVPRSASGTLSGHAAGEPFDKLVYEKVKALYPKKTYRQYEYLNDLFSKNANTIGVEARQALFDSPTVMFLLSRGKDVTKNWSLENQFEEKQNDTADILVVKDGFYEILDIKTRNISKSSQPPNIISAYKLAQMCAVMIDNSEYERFSINYFEVDWVLEKNKLIFQNAHHASLFKCAPATLYINWAAAMQIQKHVCEFDTSFTGTNQEWCVSYLKHFVASVHKRSKDMIKKFAKPFEKYLAD